jgi:enterochelin esterase-like enzyme
MTASRIQTIAAGLVLVTSMSTTIGAQGRRGAPPAQPARPGTLEHATVRDRDVVIYLPPSYAGDAARRFPSVYLFGETSADDLKLQQAGDRLARAQGFSEPVVVLANASSAGDAEKFAEELVTYTDGHYRTITARISRGLAGLSSGGNAAVRVGMKRPDVFGSLFLMSASIGDVTPASLEASAANLQRYYAIAVEIGTKDTLLASNRQLHETLMRLHVPHYYEEHDGGHADKLIERVETRLLPFFSRNLTAPANPTSPAVQ